MAWADLIRSVNRAAKELGIDITEKDIPDNYPALARLSKSLWTRVRVKRSRSKKK